MSREEKIKILTEKNFDLFVESNQLSVIDFWAPWCAPCRAVSPIIADLAEQYSGEVTFGKVNIDENNSVAERFKIMAIPTILFFKDGKLADTIVGAVPKSVIEDKIFTLQ